MNPKMLPGETSAGFCRRMGWGPGTLTSILLASVLLTAVVMVSRALWDSLKDADR